MEECPVEAIGNNGENRTMTMDCLAKPTQRTGKPAALARASVPERFRRLKWNEVVWSGDFVADERWASTVGRAGGIPSRLVCETNLSEGRGRKISTDLNQQTKTMSDDPEVPGRSAAIKQTQPLWQNSSK
jgi:hypothetical protein